VAQLLLFWVFEERKGLNQGLFNQHTIKREVQCSGIGLHSGAKVSMRLRPAPPSFGVRFRRLDACNHPAIVAHYHQVVDTFLNTSIGFDGIVISTIEHLMAALLGSSIDNVLVELDGPEVPIFDGSAAPYLELLRRAGRKEQNALRQWLRIERPFTVREGDAYIKASPSHRFRVHYTIDFPHPLVGTQELTWCFNEETFAREIAKARTFGFLKDVEKLKSMGMALGGSLTNAIVFDDFGVLNGDGFRYTDECVRHKILDFVGDLALAGTNVLGSFEAHKAGHSLHNRFLRMLIGKASSYTALSPKFTPLSIVHAQVAQGFVKPFPTLAKPV
jgi:UDP-3-O-[3-hydroxymyristoyl] N-acetylglucosamine deacetylase